MNDTYSFFRYTLPGVVFLLETIFCLLILDFQNIFDLITKPTKDFDYSIFAIIITFFTIGIGSIFTLFYRYISCLKIDYSNFLEQIKKQNIYKEKITPFPFKNDTEVKKNSWVVMSSIWYERSESNLQIKGSIERSLSLANLMHNAASSMIGSYFVFLVLILYIWLDFSKNISICSLLLSFLLSLFFICLHKHSFQGAKETLQKYTELTLWNALKQEKKIKK